MHGLFCACRKWGEDARKLVRCLKRTSSCRGGWISIIRGSTGCRDCRLERNIQDCRRRAMFINHTNHASAKWSATQAEAARAWGAIEDLPFPDVGADWDEERVARLAEENAAKILAKEPRAPACGGRDRRCGDEPQGSERGAGRRRLDAEDQPLRLHEVSRISIGGCAFHIGAGRRCRVVARQPHRSYEGGKGLTKTVSCAKINLVRLLFNED